MKLYGMRMSGNCWKAAQILSLTGNLPQTYRVDLKLIGIAAIHSSSDVP